MTTEEILRRVAAGELTAEEALPLLDAAETTQTTTQSSESVDPLISATRSAPAWGTPSSRSTRAATEPTTTVRIHAGYRSVDVVADPTVAQIAVSGTHSVRRDGTLLVIESRDTPFGGESAKPLNNFTFADLPRGLAWARQWKDARLVVRVNPELDVEVDASGANVTLAHLSAPVRLRLVASAAKLDRISGPIEIDAFTSSIKGTMLARGACRMTCESSSIKVHLDEDSDVTIKATNRLGKVVLPHGVSTSPLDSEPITSTLRHGRYSLAVDAVMSSVTLTSQDQSPAESDGTADAGASA